MIIKLPAHLWKRIVKDLTEADCREITYLDKEEPISEPTYTTSIPESCYCAPGRCTAPVLMGRQMPCRDPEKAALPNPTAFSKT